MRSRFYQGCLVVIILVGNFSVLYSANTNQVKSSIQKKIYEISGRDSMEAWFQEESSEISVYDEETIRSVIDLHRDPSAIKEVAVVVFGDAPYPAGLNENLPEEQVKLAEARGVAIQQLLKKLDVHNVILFNMTKRSSKISKIFLSKDAQVKAEARTPLSMASIEDLFYENLSREVMYRGGPGKALIMLRHEETVYLANK